MKNLSNVLVEVIDWNQLGVNLDMKSHKLKEIDKNKRGHTGDCRLALVDLWLRTDVYASWEKLIEALRKMEEHSSVIERIQTEFLQGRTAGARGQGT